MSTLERSRDQQRETAIALQLHLEDIEDRSRRNNLRLRGIPEDVTEENLRDTVKGLFSMVLDDPEAVVELDRVHRVTGPRAADPDGLRDVLRRLHCLL